MFERAMIRVLHAEDDAQVAGMVRLFFDRYATDCELQHVDSGRGCLDAMQRGHFDVVLVDLLLPDIDGLQILGELTARRDPTPVVIVSAQGQNEMAVRALRAGAVDCIDKNSPDFRRIAEIARRVAERHQSRREIAAPPRDHEAVFIDPDEVTRLAVAQFFGQNSSRLAMAEADPARLDDLLRNELAYDAVVLGPGYADKEMLDTLRQLHSVTPDTPVVILSSSRSGQTAIAAFQLGAHDYIFYQDGCLPELVFSLNHALKRADTERLNRRLSAELAELNRSLADQVTERTRDLRAEVAERKAAEHRAEDNAARLQALSNRLLRVQEDERRAIAQELHDQVGQLLTGLRFRLEACSSDPLAVPEALSITDELIRTVRELTLQLRPRMLDDLGLRPALEWHVDRFRGQTGITVELDIALPEHRLAPVLETTVYRMVQEALTNAARHSGARAAVVTVTADDQALHVEISDRGCGFDTAAALRKHTSLGLAGLAERVHLAGGHLELFSQPGQGTRIHAEFSLQHPPSPAS
jgi:signal transduction histidine kinase